MPDPVAEQPTLKAILDAGPVVMELKDGGIQFVPVSVWLKQHGAVAWPTEVEEPRDIG